MRHILPAGLSLVFVACIVGVSGCGDSGGGGGGGGGYGNIGGIGASGGTAGSGGLAGGGSGGLAGGGSGGLAGGGSGGLAGGGSGGLAGGGTGGQAGSGGSPPATIIPGSTNAYLLKGVVLMPTGPISGEVLVEGTDITCVAASCSGQSGATGATTIDTNGVILPGLIDSHNHGLFNTFDESDWNPGKLFSNHGQWNSTSEPRYGEVVDAKQYLEGVSTGANVSCEMDKYAETKAIIAGTTSFLLAGGAAQRKCYGSVARTIDTTYNDLPDDKMQVSSIQIPNTAGATKVCDNFTSGITNRYVVHCGEGLDETARKEFDALTTVASGCLKVPQTTIVHGTAFDTPEFTIMAAADMKLVWSPKSNVFLYGQTTDIPKAIAAGVKTIALAPDWALGGSVNMLDELRFADDWDNKNFGDVLTPERLFKMATIDAAIALGVDQYVGSIEVGKRADITIIGGTLADPYSDLLATTPQTVRLVMVDGRVLYGDDALKAAGPATPGCEPLDVCGVQKFLCIAEVDPGTDKLDQTFSQVKSVMETEMANYDTTISPAGGPLSPIAPLTKCN